jgi:hypothetical protein
MRPFIALALVTLCSTSAFASSEVQSAPPSGCVPVEKAKKLFSALEQGQAATFIDIDGADAAKMIRVWNDIPPISHEVAQEILIAASPAGENFVYAFVNEGLACGGIRSLPTARLTLWLRAAFVPAPTSRNGAGHVEQWNHQI